MLCTIHQPSAPLFQRFDRLLFLAPNGRPAYFGDIGPGCKTLTSYFERNGAPTCPEEANPAEWLMETIGCVPGSHSDIDWPEVWRGSDELAQVRKELDAMETILQEKGQSAAVVKEAKGPEYWEFAAPLSVQMWECLKRVNLQFWRSPSYIYSKIALTTLTVSEFRALLWDAANFCRACFSGCRSTTQTTPSRGSKTSRSASSCWCKSTLTVC